MCANGVVDRSTSTMSNFWDQHSVGIIFVVSVVGVTLLFGLILRLLKCWEERRPSATAAGDGQLPTTEDRTVTISLTSADESQALPTVRGSNRWHVKLMKLAKKIGLLSAISRQSQFAA